MSGSDKSSESTRTDVCADGLFCTAVPIIHSTCLFTPSEEDGDVKRF